MAGRRVLLVFGGRSGEHEVSVTSARLVARSIEENGDAVVAVGISPDGRWVRFDPRDGNRVPADAPPFSLPLDPSALRDFDVAFPAMHGPYGEDGSIQGVFEMAGVPYVGSDVAGAAVSLDKVLLKEILRAAGVPTVDFVSFTRADWDADPEGISRRVVTLGLPCFVKPARLGSSVGISRVADAATFPEAAARALANDDLVIAEAAGGPNEIEIGVLERPEGGVDLSVLGQIEVPGGFYDYQAKYADDSLVNLVVPAPVPDAVRAEAERLAEQVFALSRCGGLARIDFFWDPSDDRVLVNEINAIPGMTPHSMFPRVWEASGLRFADVVNRLIETALSRAQRRERLFRTRAAGHATEIGSG